MDIHELYRLRENIFQAAITHDCVPEIDENGILLMYYHAIIPDGLIVEVNSLTGINLLNQEQFVEIENADSFKLLKDKFYYDDLSASVIMSCQPWMRTIKKNNPPCMKRWDELAQTDDVNKRFCEQCDKPVYHADSMQELKEHLMKKHCIAFQLGDSVDGADTDFEFVGDPY